MAVMLPNAQVTAHVRSHEWTRDAHGTPVPSGADTVTDRGPYPCNLTRQPDESYACRLDPRMWPIRQGDELTDDKGRKFTVGPDPILHEIPGCSYIDYVEAKAVLNDPPVL